MREANLNKITALRLVKAAYNYNRLKPGSCLPPMPLSIKWLWSHGTVTNIPFGQGISVFPFLKKKPLLALSALQVLREKKNVGKTQQGNKNSWILQSVQIIQINCIIHMATLPILHNLFCFCSSMGKISNCTGHRRPPETSYSGSFQESLSARKY